MLIGIVRWADETWLRYPTARMQQLQQEQQQAPTGLWWDEGVHQPGHSYTRARTRTHTATRALGSADTAWHELS